MKLSLVPIEMVSAPNFYAPTTDGRWTIPAADQATIWMQLVITDPMGTRRFMTSPSAVMTLTFQRSDLITSADKLTTQARSVIKTAVPNATDKSLYYVILTAQDISMIISGTVKVSLNDSSLNGTVTWVQNYLVAKTNTVPGM